MLEDPAFRLRFGELGAYEGLVEGRDGLLHCVDLYDPYLDDEISPESSVQPGGLGADAHRLFGR